MRKTKTHLREQTGLKEENQIVLNLNAKYTKKQDLNILKKYCRAGVKSVGIGPRPACGAIPRTGVVKDWRGLMNVPTKLPVEAREKIYREALTKIRENLDEWYRGDKFFNSGLGHNDGKFLVSEVELIVGIAMDEGGGSYDI